MTERAALLVVRFRWLIVALWLVPRDAVSEIDEFPDEFEMKYRRVDGYSIKARLAEARERAGTLDMAPGATSE